MFIPTETYMGKFMIGFKTYEIFSNMNKVGCSFNVIPSRLLHMTYPDYLRWLRSMGAELYGRQGYTYGVFSEKEKCKEVCKILNGEWKKIERLLQSN